MSSAEAFVSTDAPAQKVRARDLDAGEKSYLARFWVGKVDLRPFAAFRIAFGLALLYDLCDLFPNLRVFFSDEGVLPRAPFISQWARFWRFSALDAFGPPALVYAYWFVAAAAVVALIFGYRTRIASVASFILVASFQERLPPLFDGSDTVIRMLLFWQMFAPVGQLWSVDALQKARRGLEVPKTAGALPFRIMQLQVAWIYLCTACHKVQGTTWRNGDAVHYTLHLSHVFSRWWAQAEWLAENNFIIHAMTWGTLVFEFGFMAFVFLPVPWSKVSRSARAVGVASVVSLHLGIAVTINVGLFSYLMPLVLLMFWEPEWIQALVDRLQKLLGASRLARVRELCLALPEPRGWEPSPSTWLSASTKQQLQKWGAVALCTWFAICTWYAVPPYIRTWLGQQASRATGSYVNPMPHWLETPVQALDVWSSWDMFSPEPLRTDYHLSAPGELDDGTKVYMLGDDETGEHRGFWFSRWYKYFENVTGGDQLLPLEWGRFLCREHNFGGVDPRKRLYTFTLYKDNQIIPPIGQPWPPVSRQVVWVHRCYDKPAQAPAQHPAPIAASPSR